MSTIILIQRINNKMEINQIFNQLPIRILGTHEEPAFYANEIARILGIKNIRQIIADFSPIELVGPVKRRELNIITYRKYRDTVRRDDSILLLSEFGIYRMLAISKSQLADQFREYIYGIIREVRLRGKYESDQKIVKLQVENQELQKNLEHVKARLEDTENKISEFKVLTERVFVYEYENDPTLFKQIDLLSDEYSSDEDTLSDDEEFAGLTLEERRKIRYRIDHPEALVGIELSKYSYIITDQILDYVKYDIVHHLYCKDAKQLIKKLSDRLFANTIGKPSNTRVALQCDKNKIIEIIKELAVMDV